MKVQYLILLFVIYLCSLTTNNNNSGWNGFAEINRQVLNPDSGIQNEKRKDQKIIHPGKTTGTTQPAPETPDAIPGISTSISELTMADPAEEITSIAAPTANEMGSANLSFPIKIPDGRNGMEPELNISYNSEGGNSWLGMDWDLQTNAVFIDTRWGVPRYDPALETETYLLNSEQLSPVAHRSVPVARAVEKQFFPRVENDFNKIIRHGNSAMNYWWEVTDKMGVKQFYGGNPVSGVDAATILKDTSGNIAYWALTETRDLHGNFVKYRYSKVYDPGNAGGSQGSALYLSSVTYTGSGTTEGKYSVEFIRDRQLGESKRTDVSVSARWGFKEVRADLLRKVFVKYNGLTIRSYELNYTTGAFYKTLLQTITEFDAAGNFFNKHNFEYYNDVKNDNGNSEPLSTATNWNTPADNIRAGFLNPIDAFNDKASMLSGNKSFGGGFGIAITLGPDDQNLAMKSFTAGVNFGFNYSKNEGMLALVDINGDGLVDKVYKKGDHLYFRPNQSGPNGTHSFGGIRDINNINDFSKGETFTGDIGLEAHFVAFAGFEYTRTEDITSVYFSDVNGDQLMDIVKDGKVYFNHLDPSGNPSFTLSSSETPSPVKGASAIDPGLVVNNPQDLEKAIDENPLHDIVKVWRAPFNGTVSIHKDVALLKDTSDDALAYTAADGVRVAIQVKGNELWSADIPANDFTPKTPTGVNAIQVQKGDKIYFRVQSKFNGAYDQVLWTPEITYAIHTPGLVDANGLDLYQFRSDDAFLISGENATGLAIGGQVRISGNFVKPVTTDDVTIKILKKSNNVFTTILEQTFPWSQAVNFPLSHNETVLKNDALYFSVSSHTNVDWTALQWNPIVYYTSSTDTLITQVFDSNNNPLIYTYPTLNFQSYNRTIKASKAWVAPVNDTFTVQAKPDFNITSQSGDLIFSIKKQQQLIARQIISVIAGVPAAHPALSVIANSGDQFFFEYYTKNQQLADAIDTPLVVVKANPGNPENLIAGLHTMDTSFIFGPMYRSWGQFAYNGNRDRANHPIVENELQLDASLTDQHPASIDLSTAATASDLTIADSIHAMQTMYDNSGGNNPREDKFIFLVPDNLKKLWIGYDNLTYVKKDTFSASRMGKDNLLPVNPISNPNPASGTTAVGINKVSNTDNYSLAVGIGPAGVSASFGNTRFLYDFNDMNGDRYPDILSNNKIQYTHPFGGLETVAKNFGFGDVSASDHFSAGFTLGGTFLKSNAASARSGSKGAKASKTATQSGIAAGINGNFNFNKDSTAFEWMDINGDELPDRVKKGGMVELNLGYSFLPEENWGYSGITEGTTLSFGAGLGFNIGNNSISGGVGLSKSETLTNKLLMDMNGDGLTDFVYYSGSTFPKVAINTGNGFAAPVDWIGATALHKGNSTGESVNGAFTIGFSIIPIVPVVKLCINPSFNIARGADRTNIQFEDIDGDGFPDFLQSDEDNNLKVSLSNIKRTNKLKKVNLPLHASFSLDYKRVGNTYQMPGNIWALASVDIYDGTPGDGADHMLNTFEYENGYYNRNERAFYGFGKVITYNHDTERGDAVYRKIEETYLNDNFYTKGLLKSEVVKDAGGNKYTETINSYVLKDIHNGTTLPNSFVLLDDGAAFPALVSTQDLFYEGQATAGVTTENTFTYDLLGNLISTTDFGEPGPDDDITSTTGYHAVPAKYIMGIPASVTVIGNGQIYRQSATTIDNNNGEITETRQYLQSVEIAKNNMEYDLYGNLTKITKPQNATGQRLSYSFQYDNEVQTYRIKSTDSYGYSYSATYDVRFGQVLSSTDINNQKTKTTIDHAGRITTITEPLELAAGIPFTLSFEYHPESVVPWALTKHYDPAHPTNFIEAVHFIDGLGRTVQTKKDGDIYVGPQQADQELMLVSGAGNFDAFGRTVTSFYPTTEAKGTSGIINTNTDNIAPTKLCYDIMDRVVSTTLPDHSVAKTEYTFGAERNGTIQFKTRTIDANGIFFDEFTNVRDLLKSTKEQYSQGTDVWTSYQYNAVDELVQVTDDFGNQIISTYDRLGRRTSVLHPDAGRTNYQYDLNNNPTKIVTANLQGSTGVVYSYDLERLSKITYPQNPQNNVSVNYGAPGAAFFSAGRVIKQQDATGTQEFFYNALGALIKNKRVVNVPDTLPLSYTTEWTYDTWNRLTGMSYPDGEKLTYKYNLGGQLQSMFGIKAGTTYNYLPQTGYDKFGARVYMRYGNNTEMMYSYEPDRRRLQNLKTKTAAGRLAMDNSYTYDKEENILSIVNNAPVPPNNLMGGKSDYKYTYDDLYRLTNTIGKYSGSSHEHRYSLNMTYDNLSNIISKNQVHERKGYTELIWVPQNKTTYNYNYIFNAGNKPHAPVHIGDKSYTYDANGNQTGWKHDISAQNRQIVWDEENRAKTISDNGELFRFTYDGSGQRVLKSKGQGQTVSINGKPTAKTSGLGNYNVYVNPYMDVRSGGFTKHFYIEGERIVSKIGESGNGNSNGTGNGNGGNGNGGGGNGNNQEAFQFYYHSDHLGNTAFVTDRLGEVYQHLEYFPFGETFVEEHSNTWRTPYLYNGKELDDETGLYYYGARYYDTKTGIWENVDPLWELPDEVNKSPYSYVINNPVNYNDPNGQGKQKDLEKARAARKREKEGSTRRSPREKVQKRTKVSLEDNYDGVVKKISKRAKKEKGIRKTRKQVQKYDPGVYEVTRLEQFNLPGGQGTANGLVVGTKDIIAKAVIRYQGSRKKDYAEAERITGYVHSPGITAWHHVHDYKPGKNNGWGKGTIILVNVTVHADPNFHHSGGVRMFKIHHGDAQY